MEDYFKVEKVARSYYFSEPQDLVAWDGKSIRGMENENEFLHLVCKHGKGRPPLNQLLNLDVKRICRLPLIKRIIEGDMPSEVYLQKSRRGEDKVAIVIEGVDIDYVVVLGCIKDYYTIRSAYPADELYIEKVKARGTLIGTLGKRE